MKIVIVTLSLIAAGTVAAAFMAGLLTNLHPEQHGLMNRILSFGWRYGLAAGITAAAMFLIIWRQQIFR